MFVLASSDSSRDAMGLGDDRISLNPTPRLEVARLRERGLPGEIIRRKGKVLAARDGQVAGYSQSYDVFIFVLGSHTC